MPRVIKKPLAKADLLAIWHYIATDNPQQADKALKHLNQIFLRLLDYPYIGRDRSELKKGLYSFALKSHVIFYSQLEDGSVEIVRVLHGSMDIEKIMQDDEIYD